MVNVVAIENAGNGASVALLHEKNGVHNIVSQATNTEGETAEQILPMLDRLLGQVGLAKKSITAVAFSQGPGGFTGLRVACGLAKGLALGLNIPIVPVSSLYASAYMVQHRLENGFIVCTIDARMQEVYLAVYHIRHGRLRHTPVLAPTLMQVEDIMSWLNQQLPRWCLLHSEALTASICLTGNAYAVYPDALVLPNQAWCIGDTALPNAEVLAKVANEMLKRNQNFPDDAPLYLRDKVAFTTIERELGMGGNPKIALPIPTDLEKQQHLFIQALMAKKCWIRPLRMAELSAVMAIEEQAHITPWTEGMFIAALMHSHYRSWALVDHCDALLGYAVQLYDPEVVHLMTIAIAPPYQAKGLARLLLQWLEMAIGLSDNPPRYQLLEVRESNSRARHLYEKAAYQQIGVRKNYYALPQGGAENALVLQKQIRAN